MVSQFTNHGKPYPGEELAKGGAPDITEFCKIIYQEALIEGVRPEVVFAQAMLETGYLQFGGDVKIDQFNFAGIGGTWRKISGCTDRVKGAGSASEGICIE